MAKYYFTFGSDERFPYGREDYVEVEAEDRAQACRLFTEIHPKRRGSDLVNCSMIYTEAEFNGFRDRFYPGRAPAETISLRRDNR